MSETPRFPDHALAREAVALSRIDGVGSVGFRARVERHGSAAEAFAATVPRADREAALRAADAVLHRAARAGLRVCVFGESDYPRKLSELHDPPPVLFTLGDLALLERRAIAIVGMRHASPGGERLARMMAREVVSRDAVVVSGMARGIDAAAHEGALDAGGGTIAVLGGGADVAYPPRHGDLHRRIAGVGLVISEADPGSSPAPGAFPRRNRLIAALSDAVLVVEAGIPSGALITSDIALELGRPVGALPGPIDSPRAAGTNRLIRDGAAIITCADDLHELAGLRRAARRLAPSDDLGAAIPADVARDVDASAGAVLDAIRRGAADLDQIIAHTSLPVREISASLVALEMHGLVSATIDGGIRMEE